MAYMSQENKKSLSPKIKEICKKYDVKATLSVNNHSTLQLNIKSGSLDVLDDSTGNSRCKVDVNGGLHDSVNVYHYKTHYTGKTLEFLSEVIPAMTIGNHNNSDIMTDYFDVGWYIGVNVGAWDKPYILND